MTYCSSAWNDLLGWWPDYSAEYTRDELSTQTCEEVTSFAGVSFTAFFAGWSFRCLWLNTLGCVQMFPLAKSSWRQTLLNTQRSWSSSLKTKNQTGRKSVESKRLTSIFMAANCCLNGKTQRNQTWAVFLGPLRCTWLSSRSSLHAQPEQMLLRSSLSVPSGPSTRGRQVARWETGDWMLREWMWNRWEIKSDVLTMTNWRGVAEMLPRWWTELLQRTEHYLTAYKQKHSETEGM